MSITLSSVDDLIKHVESMRAIHRSGVTLPLTFRVHALKTLRSYLQGHEDEALQALHDDLGKAPYESFTSELGLVYDEIKLCLRKLCLWAHPRWVPTPIEHFPASSTVYPTPYGVAAILSPWNYPLQLSLVPLVDAIAAGNSVVLKPSRTSAHTNAFISKMCDEIFDPEHICCLPPLPEINDWVLQVRFDKIFFTGSPKVGRTIMKTAAEHLTDITLELGGKSPCIVDKTANLKRAGQRIAWGKCLNSGQTCVAPDYLLVHEDVVDELVSYLDLYFHEYFGHDILACDHYPHMINEHHFDRVCSLIDEHNPDARIVVGGARDRESLRIEPTVMTGVTADDPVMGQEIFGPVLPIITWRVLDEALAFTDHFGHPLACYVFSEDRRFQQQVIHKLPFGGGCINDVVIHVANNNMGFGGFAESGIGAYHGKVGFDSFTHYKSTVSKGTWIELPVRTPPFTDLKMRLAHLLMG